MPRSDQDRIADILESSARIERFIVDLDERRFKDDPKTLSAVMFEITLIGEAAKGVSQATRAALPGVPWAAMAGMRDIIVHQYFGVDLPLVWRTAKESVPAMAAVLRSAAGRSA